MDPDPAPASIQPSARLLDLGPEFFDEVSPAAFPQLTARWVNTRLSHDLNFPAPDSDFWPRHFGRFEPLEGNLPRPLAMRYHGHQFRHYNPDLGDGRGFTFAQFLVDGVLHECGTKGSGQTPYSRQGDGRLTLKGAVREALCTAMLEARGVDTSRTLCFFETGESLIRHDEPSPTRAAVLTRWSRGHIRIGSFERLLALGRLDLVPRLRDYALQSFEPDLDGAPASERTAIFFERCARRLADLVASFMTAGFVHGVLNSDNINVSGESFDYGPYRFLPVCEPGFTAAYFDHSGLYCYARQPSSFLWNLERLGECLQRADEGFDPAPVLKSFGRFFSASLVRHGLNRLNLEAPSAAHGEDLITSLFEFLESSRIPFEGAWFDLHSFSARDRTSTSPRRDFYRGPAWSTTRELLAGCLVRDPARASLPRLGEPDPCDLLIDEIETLWSAIADRDDWAPFQAKIAEIERSQPLSPRPKDDGWKSF